jgi:hypothetical protein
LSRVWYWSLKRVVLFYSLGLLGQEKDLLAKLGNKVVYLGEALAGFFDFGEELFALVVILFDAGQGLQEGAPRAASVLNERLHLPPIQKAMRGEAHFPEVTQKVL